MPAAVAGVTLLALAENYCKCLELRQYESQRKSQIFSHFTPKVCVDMWVCIRAEKKQAISDVTLYRLYN